MLFRNGLATNSDGSTYYFPALVDSPYPICQAYFVIIWIVLFVVYIVIWFVGLSKIDDMVSIDEGDG
jgi:hypothetical protein